MLKVEHDENSPDLTEDVYEPAPEPPLEDLENIRKILHNIKLKKKVVYLEEWREDYLKRIGHIMDCAVSEPEDYGNVLSMLFQFEEFFTKMMMVIAEAETMKKSYSDFQEGKKKKPMGMEYK